MAKLTHRAGHEPTNGSSPAAGHDPLTAALAAVLEPLIREAIADAFERFLPPERPPTLLTRAELARELGICSKSVSKLVREGMPHVVLGEVMRFSVDDVVQWAAKRTSEQLAHGRRRTAAGER